MTKQASLKQGRLRDGLPRKLLHKRNQSRTCSSASPPMEPDSHSEDTLSALVLENVKNKLIRAFRGPAESRAEPRDSGPRRSPQADEELRRAQIDGAITWLRSELLEMRSQDLQLAQTLLGLNTEIQRLRRESCGGVEVEGDEHK